jgi:hypothetical protein
MQPRKIPDAVRGKIIARAWDGETFAHIARASACRRTKWEGSRCVRAASPPEPS